MENKEKIINLEDLKKLRGKHQNIAFCDGIFNSINPDDLIFLKKCKNFCDFLVVGIKRDSTINKLNDQEPNYSEQSRANLIASLIDIDYVILNDEKLNEDNVDTSNIINELSPNSYISNRDNDSIKKLCEGIGIQFIVI